MTDRTARYINEAQTLIDAGFCTKAAQKRATECLNRAYEGIRNAVHDLVIEDARMSYPDWQSEAVFPVYMAAIYANDLPFDLHQVRTSHIAIISAFDPASAEIVKELIAMRQLAKISPITPVVKDEVKVRVEAVRASIIEEMTRRHEQYVEALDVARLFDGLPVSVNAHWVRHEQGTMFLRHFFYLRGRIMPLQVLLAAADTHAREKEAAK